MKKLMFLFLSLSIFFAGCDNDALVPDAMNDAALKSGKMVERTIKFIQCSGVMEVVQNDACDNGMLLLVHGDGQASHIGHFTVINTTCVDENFNPVSPLIGEITAANGDKICTMVTKEPWMENGVIHYYYQIQPELCTGRFENATGYIIMWGDIDFIAMTWDLKGEGKITY